MTFVANLPYEYFLGRACRKYRRGVLDMSASNMIAKAGLTISRSRVSDFERGRTHSTKLIPVYFAADPAQAGELKRSLTKATNEYLEYLAKQKAIVVK